MDVFALEVEILCLIQPMLSTFSQYLYTVQNFMGGTRSHNYICLYTEILHNHYFVEVNGLSEIPHCKNISVILTLVMVASVAFSIYMVSYYIQPELLSIEKEMIISLVGYGTTKTVNN